jgi:hypothetical protein
MNKGRSWLLISLVVLGLTQPAQAQFAAGAGGPVFASDPTPPPSPEFCPPDSQPVRTSSIPLSELCPSGNAFFENCSEAVYVPKWYFGLGAMALRRTDLDSGRIALQEPSAGNANPETGSKPPKNSIEILNFEDVPMHFNAGIRGTLGINFGANALELSGYYLMTTTTSQTVSSEGRLDVLFADFPIPKGFTGSGGNLWLQADQVVVGYSTSIYNLELNYRYVFARGIEFLGGFRYFNLRERLNIFTDDDILSLGIGNPLAQANYTMEVRNRILAPQFGFELEQNLIPIVSVGLTGKAAIGANFSEVVHTLELGDGFQGPGSTRNELLLSGLADVSAFTQFWFNNQLRLRVGYNFLWLLQIPEARQQIDFNTTNAQGIVDNNGNIFFHGPFLEFQVAF